MDILVALKEGHCICNLLCKIKNNNNSEWVCVCVCWNNLMISMPGNLMQINISLRFVRKYSLQFVITLCRYSLCH